MAPIRILAGIAIAWAALAAHAAGDAARGAEVFNACAACHSVEPGNHMTGPSLAGVVGRKAAALTDFHRYSDALKRSGLVWTADELQEWLENPQKLVPGTSMTFAGLRDARDRDDVIAYLASSPKPGAAAGARNGMMRSRKLDLKHAPVQGQVTSITYCGDTYTVTTADGRSEKAWEFNLRFKTDSSALGPAPGKPVAIGAGMRGDRASIVFAAPDEISTFIRRKCP